MYKVELRSSEIVYEVCVERIPELAECAERMLDELR